MKAPKVFSKKRVTKRGYKTAVCYFPMGKSARATRKAATTMKTMIFSKVLLMGGLSLLKILEKTQSMTANIPAMIKTLMVSDIAA